MFNFISKLLYSLKSEKAKRRDMEKAFAAVGEPPEPSLGERVLAWCKEKILGPIIIGLVLLGVGVLVKCQQESQMHSQPQKQSQSK